VPSNAGHSGPETTPTRPAGNAGRGAHRGGGQPDGARPGGAHPGGAHGKAGRDLKAATTVGAALAVLVGGSLLLWKPAFVGVVALAAVVAVWELSHALGQRGVRVPLVPVLLGAVLMVSTAYTGGADSLMLTLGLTCAAVLVWRLGERHAGFVRDVTAGLFVTLYVPFLAAFAAILLRPEDGHLRVLVVFVVVVASDTGGYLAGVTMGRHPMAPTVSPNKSWEGFVGSLVGSSVAGIVSVVFLLEGTWWAGLVVGLAGMLAATLGDLGESLIKRDLGIKDMSALLPGHGGLMDRVDSLLTTLPVAWILLTALVEVA
jgi:phosphatidate cytidylyltransferase